MEKSGGLCEEGGTEAGLEAGTEAGLEADTESPARPYAKLPPVPDLGNHRFCRACGKTLPVEAFPAGRRRYLCRRHMYLRVKKPSKERALADPHKKLLWALWKRCWGDARRVFGQECAVPPGGAESAENPTQPVSRANVVVVDRGARRGLLAAFRGGGAARYGEELGGLE